jgi:phenylacetate-CoA ligase
MPSPVWQYRSAVPGIAWPAIPGQEGAAMLALQFQLERTQWLSPEKLLELQFRQLDVLLRHAWETVPYYRECWRGLYDPSRPLTPEAFGRLPLLTRDDLRIRFASLRSASIPSAHGQVVESRTSGSTGQPVRVLKTSLLQLIWRVIVLREHRWFDRDLAGKLAAIRHGAEESEADGWGSATDVVAVAGSSATLPITIDVDSQLAWLVRQQPDYLLTYSSNLGELARTALARGIRLERLRETRAMGESLGEDVRNLVRQAWGVGVTDAYSANEVGYIALQCPQHAHYHLQSETVRTEILREDGQYCSPGEVGRVIVTDLHNYATPLIRYQLGDFAEAGHPCDCGRGLPVLGRVHGRIRNMLTLADGRRYWPLLGSSGFDRIAPVSQHQLIQKSFEVIEARLVTPRPLTPQEEEGIRRQIRLRLPADFEIRLVRVGEITRNVGGKFEVFMSELG